MAEEKDVEYVYEKPKETRKSNKILILVLILIILVISSLYFLLISDENIIDINLGNEILNDDNHMTNEQTYTIGNQTFTIPTEYKREEALDYVRENYSSSFNQARDFCINQFNGNWTDEPQRIGCYDMEGFSILFCTAEDAMGILNFCHLIEGIPTCSSTELSCEL
jgi:hypothetical protein